MSDASPTSRLVLVPLVVSVFYALLIAAWVATNPPGAAPDEVNHYVRALAVGRGDLVGRSNPQLTDPAVSAPLPKSRGQAALQLSWAARGARLVHVPGGLGPTEGFGCEGFDPTKTSLCQKGFAPDPVGHDQLTTMGTVEPGPYVLPGLATRLARSPRSGLLLARAAGALLVALLLASSVISLWSLSPVALVGVLVAVTPMVVFVGAALSGSGLEVGAAVCFFAALMRVAFGSGVSRTAWLLLGVSGFALASSRSLGPVWILLGVMVVTGAVGVGPLWTKTRAAGVWAACAVTSVVIASGLTAAWEVAYQPGVDFDFGFFRHEIGPSASALQGVGSEAVGVFGSLDTHLPRVVYLAWAVLLVALILTAFAVGNWRQRVTLMALVPGVVGLTVLVSAGILRQNGFGLQGRHVLPMATLVPLLAGALIASNADVLGAFLRRWIVVLVAGPVLLIQGLAWYVNGRRYAVGADGPVRFFGVAEWVPPAGWVVWAVVVGVAAAAALVTVLRAALTAQGIVER